MHPWQRLEKWFKANAPRIHRDLLDPATQGEIEEAEKTLGLSYRPKW